MSKLFSSLLNKLFQFNKAVIVMYVLLIGGGVWALLGLPTEFIPDTSRPSVVTTTDWNGASPSEVERYITKPLEDKLYTLEGVYKISSTSGNGVSSIRTEFGYGTNADIKALTVQNELQSILDELPSDIDSSPVSINGKENDGVISYFLYGEDISEVSEYAKDMFKESLESVAGVGEVLISGETTREIYVSIDNLKMRQYGVSLDKLLASIEGSHTYTPVGEVRTTENKISVLFDGKLENIKDIEDIVVKSKDNGNIYLRDIAAVEMSYKDLDSSILVNGKSAVKVEILRQSGYDFLTAASNIRERIITIVPPEGIVIEEGETAADEIGTSIGVLKSNGTMGFVLAITILFVFLRSIGASIVIGLSIPISFILTFLVFKLMGVSLSMLTLMGLSLGVGMLVDNSVVVLDSIDSTIEKKGKSSETIEEAVTKVVSPITAATLTSVIVFVPILLVGGMATELFRGMAAAIVISIISSLLVSITFIPIASEYFISGRKRKKESLGRVKKVYAKVLAVALRKKAIILVSTLVIFIGSLSLFSYIELGFLAESDEGYYGLSIETPRNFSLERKEELGREVDEKLASNEYTKWYQKSVEDAGIVYVVALKDERPMSAMEIRDSMRDVIGTIPDTKINYFLDAGFDSAKDIELQISSGNIDVLKKNMDYILNELSSVEGLVDITSSYWDMLPQVSIDVDEENLGKYGLTKNEVNRQLAIQVNGLAATSLNSESGRIDVVVRSNANLRNSIKDLEKLYIDLPSGGKVLASEVVNFGIRSELLEVSKENRIKYFNFSTNVDKDASKSSVEVALNEKIASLNLPTGIDFQYVGEAEDQAEVMTALAMSLIGAIGLIYFVLVVQFNSFVLPLIIMGAIPLSLVGVIVSIFIAKVEFDVMAMIGIVILSGVIVNNALVLIEYIANLEEEGMPLIEACIEGGKERIRPILITTFTTMFGMLPMTLGLGQGSEIYRAMAIGFSGGLALSTLLTLVVIPILYTLYRKIVLKREAKINKKQIKVTI